jgi:hypothetical protein
MHDIYSTLEDKTTTLRRIIGSTNPPVKLGSIPEGRTGMSTKRDKTHTKMPVKLLHFCENEGLYECSITCAKFVLLTAVFMEI